MSRETFGPGMMIRVRLVTRAGADMIPVVRPHTGDTFPGPE